LKNSYKRREVYKKLLSGGFDSDGAKINLISNGSKIWIDRRGGIERFHSKAGFCPVSSRLLPLLFIYLFILNDTVIDV